MAVSPSTLIRSAVVLGVVGYCAWPIAIDSGSTDKEKKLPEISQAQLTPKLPSAPKRDPFRSAGSSVAKTKAKPQANSKTESTVAKAGSGATPGASAGGRASASSNPAATGQTAAAAAQKAAASPADLLAALTLNATSVRADERLAVISGRLYEEGEPLKNQDPAAPRWVVSQITPYKVVLSSAGQTAVLKYADGPARPKAAANRSSAAAPAAAVAGARPQSQPPRAPAAGTPPSANPSSRASTPRHD